MNNLKFRAWHIKNEKYYHVIDISYRAVFEEDDIFDKTPNMFRLVENDLSDDLWVTEDEVILEQYTGLKDKNGKEIYVGDIIDSDGIEYIYIIANRQKSNIGCNGGKYDYYVTGIVPTRMDGTIDEWGNCEFAYIELIEGNITVIGNIHEDKELL